MPSHTIILGSNGQIGWELQRALSPIGKIYAYERLSCDLSKPDALRKIVATVKPQIIVNAAAYTSVDKAEQDSVSAYAINATAVEMLADLALKNRALLVHYSTDYVFSDNKSSAYVEIDPPNPLSVYGASKFCGEQAIIASGCNHLIFRISWVFAARGANFAKTMLRLGNERESLRIVADQYGAPTSAELIADVTAHAIRDVLAKRAPGGLYHLAASGETSWHGYASYIFEQAALLGADLKVKSVEPITAAEYPLQAARPTNSRLDTTKLQTAFNLTLPDWRYHVRRLLDKLIVKS